MKKIINGKKYDTSTAELLLSHSSNPITFQYVCEALYQKRNGEFFLYGEGGPSSKYAQPCGTNNWSGGSNITPLTIEEAKRWVEDHGDADDYERIFGEVSE